VLLLGRDIEEAPPACIARLPVSLDLQQRFRNDVRPERFGITAQESHEVMIAAMVPNQFGHPEEGQACFVLEGDPDRRAAEALGLDLKLLKRLVDRRAVPTQEFAVALHINDSGVGEDVVQLRVGPPRLFEEVSDNGQGLLTTMSPRQFTGQAEVGIGQARIVAERLPEESDSFFLAPHLATHQGQIVQSLSVRRFNRQPQEQKTLGARAIALAKPDVCQGAQGPEVIRVAIKGLEQDRFGLVVVAQLDIGVGQVPPRRVERGLPLEGPAPEGGGAGIVAALSTLHSSVRQFGGLVSGVLRLLRIPDEKIIPIDVKKHGHRQEGEQRPDAHRQLGGILPLWPRLAQQFEQAGERTFKGEEGDLHDGFFVFVFHD
jgi:hypothetical protein